MAVTAEAATTRGGLWAIVPVKPLHQAKSRLTGVVRAEARPGLALAMAKDVLRVLSATEGLAGVVVVTADPIIAQLARRWGFEVCGQPGEGLEDAIRAGAGHAEALGGAQFAYLPADVPLIQPDAMTRLVTEVREAFCSAIAPDSDRDGTNLLAWEVGRTPLLSFGTGSFSRHVAHLGVALEIHDEALAFDVDEPSDLALLRARLEGGPDQADATRDWLIANPATDAEWAVIEAASAGLLGTFARRVRDRDYGADVSYSRKVFVPLTHLCRDSCHYCTFAKAPRQVAAPYMTVTQAVEVARQGAALGCKEALLTLGERPETRYAVARAWLDDNGFADTVDYVATVAAAIVAQTGLLPHINMGVLSVDEFARLRTVSASMGAMIETLSPRLAARGGPHFGSPDKQPEALRAMLHDAGRARVPFTTGLLIGIGETRCERIEALVAIRDAHRAHGHIQEVIVQNFVPKPDTRMADVPGADMEELAWTISVARLLLPAEISLQAPPNLSPGALARLIDAGINDWGGVSPLTPDFVNPEMPWPSLTRLAEETQAAGKRLVERLTVYPRYIEERSQWLSPKMASATLALADARLLAREDGWITGMSTTVPPQRRAAISTDLTDLIDEVDQIGAGHLRPAEIARLFTAEGEDYDRIAAIADRVRASLVGDTATFVVNRNINYTNICAYRCSFCAFSKGDRKRPGGDAPYRLDMAEIADRTGEAWERGGTEVCLQGGIHPSFTGETYLEICRTVRAAAPGMHIHAFSPLEVHHGADTLGLPVAEFLKLLKAEGLGSLPGTAAEILHDPVRDVICPDKLRTDEWLEVIGTAHEVGLPTTSTIMFGHVDSYLDWGIHLDQLRALQRRTGGITEFVPLPFVADEAPMYRKGLSRRGPTFREAVLMHAIGRLVLSPHIRNIQASWVKMGAAGLSACLHAGVNDLGGVLMDESITRAAGATHGRQMSAADLRALALAAGRNPVRRTTLYGLIEETELVAC